MTEGQQSYANGTHSSRKHLCCSPASASAQPLSRADAVAQALASNPTVKLSLEQVALLEGRIVEASADALPDITWNTLAMRSRDPGALEQPELRRVSAGVSRRTAAASGERAFRRRPTSGRRLFSFKLGKALEAARVARAAGEQDMQRARQLTALDAIRAYNQLLFTIEQLRVIADERAVEADARRLRAQSARGRCGNRARGASRRSRPRERARRGAARRERSVRLRARLLNTVMLRPTSHASGPHRLRSRSCRSRPNSTPRSRKRSTARPELQLLAHAGARAGAC